MRAQRSGESALLLLDAIDLLKRESVPYAVVGADAELAVAAAGRDLDLPLVRRLASQYGGETVLALETSLTAKR